MAIFHDNEEIFFSLSPSLETGQFPYIFLLSNKTKKIVSVFSLPAALIGISNFFFCIIYAVFVKLGVLKKTDAIIVLFCAIALFVFFTFFMLFIFIRKKSPIINSKNLMIDKINLSKIESFSIYLGCFSSISTAILCISLLGLNLNYSSYDDILLSFFKIIAISICLSMDIFCFLMLKSFSK